MARLASHSAWLSMAIEPGTSHFSHGLTPGASKPERSRPFRSGSFRCGPCNYVIDETMRAKPPLSSPVKEIIDHNLCPWEELRRPE